MLFFTIVASCEVSIIFVTAVATCEVSMLFFYYSC